MVLWDKIIRRGESAILNLKDMKAKYYFFDDGHGLRFVYQLCVCAAVFLVCTVWVKKEAPKTFCDIFT